jgi:hypothetical protein
VLIVLRSQLRQQSAPTRYLGRQSSEQ